MNLIALSDKRGPNAVIRVKRPSDKRSLSRSATRALDVLEFLGEVRRPLRAVEISQRLGMHPSTTSQLLKTMVDSGHLVFEARGKTYLPSPRLAEFGGWMAETYGAGGRLRDLVREVQEGTGEVVTATTANDLFMQIVDFAAPADRQTERGLRVSLFGSTIGSAYLAMLPDAEIERLAYRARVLPADLPGVLVTAAEIRRDGYADGASTDGSMWSIAMPLPMQGLSVPMVLGLAGMAEPVHDRLEELVAIMHDAIERWNR